MLNRLVMSALRYLPQPLRRSFYLGRVHVEPTELESVTIRLATDARELEGACRLVHDAYVQRGILAPASHGLRLTAFALLPTTSTFVAVRGGEVVGTISVVEDSPLGLPMEDAYPAEIAALRARGQRIAEIGGLAVAAGERRRGIAFLLENAFIRLLHHGRRVDLFTLAIHPNVGDYYKALYCAKDLGPVRDYGGSLRNAPAVALTISMGETERFWRAARNGPARTFGELLFGEHANVELPAAPTRWSEREIARLVTRRGFDLAKLPAKHRAHLARFYPRLFGRPSAIARVAA
jgi:hypothetical protein